VARLEAGLLAHPFHGAVRRRVVGLAWLLCDSARQVRRYVKLAELDGLSSAETSEFESLVRSLSDSHPRHNVVLPPPPAHFVGRETELATLTGMLTQARPCCTVITGMPGIGKTCLAIVAAHQLASGHHGPAPFADDIYFLSCAGRRGVDGAYSILKDVLALQQPYERLAASRGHSADADARDSTLDGNHAVEGALARTADHVRQTLANKRVLVILDGIEPDLPLDAVVDAILPFSFSPLPVTPTGASTLTTPAVLITSRYLPRVSPRVHHLHLQALPLEDGVRLIEHEMDIALDADERKAALRLCAAVGGVPFVIKAATTTLAQTGIPLVLLASATERNPLAMLSASTAVRPGSVVARTLDTLPAETRAQLALLSVLGAESFGLNAVAALRQQTPASAAILAGDLIRHSLLEPERTDSDESSVARRGEGATTPMRDARFRLPPLLRAYAIEQARSLPRTMVAAARRNLGAYADAYVERHRDDTQALAAEADVLGAALRYAMRDGEHERTIRLVWGLLPLATQRDTCGGIERLVLAGVRASRKSADRCMLVPLLNLLGVMRFYQGDYARAQRAWMEGMQVAGGLGTPHPYHGHVYLNLAQLADVEGEPNAAWHLAELGIHYSRRAGDAAAIAKALLVQAERARRRGKQHTAYTYAHEGLNLVVAAGTDQTSCYYAQVHGIAARVELARIERDYTVASQSADQYLALADSPYRLFLAEDLIEQAEYALEADENQDAIRLADHALAIANAAHATRLAPCARALRYRAEQPGRRWCGDAAGA
jgi:hypothetical protein